MKAGSALLHPTRLLAPRWRKVGSDLIRNRARTLLVALSIAVGVFVIGMIAGARDIILSSLAANAAQMNPPSATLAVEPFNESLLTAVRQVPGVGAAEARRNLIVRVQSSAATWRDLQLFAIPDFDRMALNRVWPQSGAWPPPRTTLLLERTSLLYLGVQPGENLTIELPNGKQLQMSISGATWDLSQPPANQFGLPNGYISMDTLAWLGQSPTFNQLYVMAQDRENWQHAQDVAARVRDSVERRGPRVLTMTVPQPGRFWAMSTADSLLLLLGALGVLSLFMSGFLVINTASALLTQQVKQIGIMKSLGADTSQLTRMYLAMIFIFGIIALVIGIPLGAVAARGLVAGATRSLNFNPLPFRIARLTFGLELAAGLLLPALAALVPIISGSRTTIREAIGGRLGSVVRESPLDVVLQHLRLSRPFVLALRNTLRNRARLLLTMATLILASAIFIGVQSVRGSILLTNVDAFKYSNYDIQLDLVQPYPAPWIEQQALSVPGVERAEVWLLNSAYRLRSNGTKGDTLQVLGVNPASDFIQPQLTEGRWLLPTDRRAIVIDSQALKNEPDLRVGDQIVLQMGKMSSTWQVVGAVKGFSASPVAYVKQPELAAALGQFVQANRVVVVTSDHSGQAQAAVYRALEQRFERANLLVGGTALQEQLRATIQAGWNVVISALMLMAILLGIAGGLGLMATMSINVVERTREIGVMRAIGASDGAIMRIVVSEGVLTGLASWALGVLASVPLSGWLSNSVGQTFLNAPLSYTYSRGGALLWLGLMIVMAAIASYFPARRAARLTVRDVLSYEG